MPVFSRLTALWLLLPIAGVADTRSWTNSAGKVIEAELISATAESATLKLGSGQNYEVPLSSLSGADQTFVKGWLEDNVTSAKGNREPVGFENWDNEWPSLISSDVSPEITEKGTDEEGRFVYHSPHYEFVVDTNLSASVVKKFAVLFEATNAYMRELPLSMARAQTERRHRILLFATADGYHSAGGPVGSAGVYTSIGEIDYIMVPLSSLGVENTGTRWIVDYDKGNQTLPHEIAHQLTDVTYFVEGSNGWFTEGMAEYVGLTPYRSGKFNVKMVRNDMKDYVTDFNDNGFGRNLGTKITLPAFRDWAMQSYSSFVADGMRNYGAAALMFYYFAHMDGDEMGTNMLDFCKALKSGKKGEDALEALLAGRTYAELEKEISTKWGSRGVDFTFRKSD